jgi:hypothetical protein
MAKDRHDSIDAEYSTTPQPTHIRQICLCTKKQYNSLVHGNFIIGPESVPILLRNVVVKPQMISIELMLFQVLPLFYFFFSKIEKLLTSSSIMQLNVHQSIKTKLYSCSLH